jgi:hypothetical protein
MAGPEQRGEGGLMATFADVRRLGGRFPGVEEGTSYGTPALKVGGKAFCRTWRPSEHARDGVHGTEVLVVFCDMDEKELLIERSDALFTTPHYDGYAALCVRLADVDEGLLAELLEDSYRAKAP